jgi:RNA polymerase sigma factor (sigma-70 family)
LVIVKEDLSDGPFGSLFDSHPEKARKQVETLRSKLSRYFTWRRCHSPEELVSETIYRALSQIGRGKTVPNLDSYCYGIAMNVIREQRKEREEEEISHDPVDTSTTASGSLDPQERRRLLEECLLMVSAEDRAILKEYYLGDRTKLAARAGLTPTALRVKICRIVARIRERAGGKGSEV